MLPQLKALVGRFSKLGDEAFYRFYIPIEDSESEIQAIIEILQRKNGMETKRGEIFPSVCAAIFKWHFGEWR